MDDFKPIIAKLATGSPLTREEARHAFDKILSGESTPAQTAAFLMALRVRGETNLTLLLGERESRSRNAAQGNKQPARTRVRFVMSGRSHAVSVRVTASR